MTDRDRAAAIVIPTLNGGERLDAVLDAVLAQQIDECAPPEVVCVDSGSRPRERRRLDRPGVRVIDLPPGSFNHGATRALGIRATRAPFVALLTQDALPADRHWLAALIDALSADPRAAGAWSRQLVRPAADPLERWKMHHWLGGATERRRAELPPGRAWNDLSPDQRYSIALFDDVSSCARRTDWLRFPLRRVDFGEDLDRGARVIAAGRRLLFVPESRVVHSHPARLLRDSSRVYADHRNIIRLTGWRTVPSLAALPRAAAGGWLDMARYVWRTTAPARRGTALLRAAPYAAALSVAQWAAARVEGLDAATGPG